MRIAHTDIRCFKNICNSPKLFCSIVLLFNLSGCSDFVEVELPNNRLTSESVFDDPATTDAVLRGIYGKMRDGGLTDGVNGLSILMGLYSDELDVFIQLQDREDFQNHNVQATNTIISLWWNNVYNQIYEANAVIEGVSSSSSLALHEKNQFIGEALFIRGYLHFLLVELFGDVPYVTSKDYLENTDVFRMSKNDVYEAVFEDLTTAAELLPKDDPGTRSIRPNAMVVNSILARAHLYRGNWELAEDRSTEVIDTFGALEPDLDQVFLIDSQEIIWQLKSELEGQNTKEGDQLVISSLTSRSYALNAALLDAFESGDLRQSRWIGEFFDGNDTLYFAFKYKEGVFTSQSMEYSVQLRLAEQYLIRSEARAEQGKMTGAQSDLNVVRNRAGLPNTTAGTKEELLAAILQERQVELFTEQGHRWFDLVRMDKAKEVLEPLKPGWRDTDILLPLPESELLLNPNLLPQNEGY